MADYDSEDDNEYSPEELAQQEQEAGEYYNDDPSFSGEKRLNEDVKSDAKGDLRRASEAANSAEGERQAINDRLGNLRDRAAQADGANFYRDEKKRQGLFGKKKPTGNSVRNRKALFLGAGGGAIGIVIAISAMFGHLQLFQTDHFLKNIESKTAKRLNASLDARNDYLVRSYIKMRMTSLGDDKDADTLFFRANKVDTNNPIKDWYRTMRTSKFEDDLLTKQGIKFTSLVDKDGKINTGVITVKDTPIDFNTLNSIDQGTMDGILNGNVASFNKLGSDLDKFVDVQVFQNHKEARSAIRTAVNDNTHFSQVFKRRHLRKDIANMTGVRKWRLFDPEHKIAQNVQQRKDRLYNKMIDRFYSNNPNTANMLKCLFSDGKCAKISDPASDETKAASALGDEIPGDTSSDGTDGDGKPKNTPLDEKGVASDVEGALTETVGESAAKIETEGMSDRAVKKLERASVGTKWMYAMIAKLTGKSIQEVLESAVPVNPLKYWTIAKRIAKVHFLFTGGDNSTIAKQVKNAKRSQVEGLFATYQMANSQLHTGKLAGDELNAFFETTKHFGNSEGWNAVNGTFANGKVAAATQSNLSKNDYCSKSIEERNTPTETYNPGDQYAWLCDDQRPGYGGNAAELSKMYSNSLGPVIAPIAQAVDLAEKSAVGSFINWVSEGVNGAFESISDATIKPLMDSLGITKAASEVFGALINKLMVWLGAGPMFDGSQPGNVTANLIVAGGAATAESSTRTSGGVTSTAETLALSAQLANQFDKAEKQNESLYDRYASLENPTSFVSTLAMSIHPDQGIGGALSTMGNTLANLPQVFGSLFSGTSSAQTTGNGGEIADWAGIDKYDIPKECISLDPLDPDYIKKSTNAQLVLGQNGVTSSFSPSVDTLRDTDKFYKDLYAAIGDKDNAEEIAGKVYNCALLDARVMGSLGSLYGYDKDNGYVDGGGASAASSGTTAGGLGVSPDGFVFPVKTSKSLIKAGSSASGQTLVWCYDKQDNCHHDYNAADIFGQTGTPVLAATDGSIVHIANGTSGGTGSFVIMKSSKGFIFYYGHLGAGTVKVQSGQQVKAGYELGQIGTSADAQGTAPHLHFDAQPSPPATTREGCINAACTQPPFNFINVQSALVPAYNALPE